MRMIMQVRIPHEEFNELVRKGKIEQKLKSILDEIKPEAAYFVEYEGQRGAIIVIDIKDQSEFPRFAEPWFLSFNADVEFHAAMTPEDLGKAGLTQLAKKWA